jgi:hypothetical protein
MCLSRAVFGTYSLAVFIMYTVFSPKILTVILAGSIGGIFLLSQEMER